MNKLLKCVLVFSLTFSMPVFAQNSLKEINLSAKKSDFKLETTNNIKNYEASLKNNFSESNVVKNGSKEIKKTENKLPYNFLDVEAIPIKLSIVESISTKKGLYEGQKVKFVVAEKVIYNKTTILHEGDPVEATVENIITPGMNGFPAEILLDHFVFPNISNTQVMGAITQIGSNRCFWVYPLKWALTPIPLAGSLTNFIMGGNAKIEPKDTIVVYYYPNWK